MGLKRNSHTHALVLKGAQMPRCHIHITFWGYVTGIPMDTAMGP